MPSDSRQPTHSLPTPLSQRCLAAVGDILVTVFAVVLLAASFLAKYPEAYLFPRILAVILALLCVFQLVMVARGTDTIDNITEVIGSMKNMLPIIGMIIVYVALAEWLGFYLSAALAYFAVALVGGGSYDSRHIAKTAVVALGVTVGLYILFSLLLQVQSPRGLLL